MLTFKEHSIKKIKSQILTLQCIFRCVEILFPSDLIKVSDNTHCASFFFAQLRGSHMKEKQKTGWDSQWPEALT